MLVLRTMAAGRRAMLSLVRLARVAITRLTRGRPIVARTHQGAATKNCVIKQPPKAVKIWAKYMTPSTTAARQRRAASRYAMPATLATTTQATIHQALATTPALRTSVTTQMPPSAIQAVTSSSVRAAGQPGTAAPTACHVLCLEEAALRLPQTLIQRLYLTPATTTVTFTTVKRIVQ